MSTLKEIHLTAAPRKGWLERSRVSMASAGEAGIGDGHYWATCWAMSGFGR
jgi:hypothetical protein